MSLRLDSPEAFRDAIRNGDRRAVARAITYLESTRGDHRALAQEILDELVPDIVADYNAKAGKSVRHISDRVWEALRAHDWPGNVRELRNVIERCVLFSQGEVFPAQWLQLSDQGDRVMGASEGGPESEAERLSLPLDGSMSLDDMDRLIVRTALERSGFNLSAAARALGTSRQTVRYRAAKYGLMARADAEDD